MAKQRWILKPTKAITALEAKIAAEARLHNRYNQLTSRIEQVRENLSAAQDFEADRRFGSELCELEIELQSVTAKLDDLALATPEPAK